MKRCSIIGSNGYLGKHLKWYLEKKGIVPYCYDVADNKEVNYLKIDLTDQRLLKSIRIDVDYIFLCAGITGTYAGFDRFEEYIKINEMGLLNLLDFIRKSKYRPRIIFPSTRLIFKGKDKPLEENDEKETKTIYAVNKLACEGFLQAYNYSFDIPYTIFRLCVPYGNLIENNYSYGTIGFFVKLASEGRDITLYGDGSIKRTFTHIHDVCFQMVDGAFNPKSINNIYNIGGETFTLKDVANIIAKRFDKKVTFIPWPEKDIRIESNHTYFNDTKIQNLLHNFEYLKIMDFSHQL